jgi:purine-binding chemotaxis protein CheW
MYAMNDNGSVSEFVTVMVGTQLFGLPIACVQDVFKVDRLTRIPLASAEIAGVVNLRGRIVTVIDMRRQLGLAECDVAPNMALGIEFKGESFGLLIDAVGEVLKLADSSREPNPVNLDARLARVACGVHRLEDQLLVVLDVVRVLDVGAEAAAA